MAERLVEDIFTALDEQTVVVPGTDAAAVIVPKLAKNLAALLDQRKQLVSNIEELLKSHPFRAPDVDAGDRRQDRSQDTAPRLRILGGLHVEHICGSVHGRTRSALSDHGGGGLGERQSEGGGPGQQAGPHAGPLETDGAAGAFEVETGRRRRRLEGGCWHLRSPVKRGGKRWMP
jgi:hypothetical protein